MPGIIAVGLWMAVAAGATAAPARAVLRGARVHPVLSRARVFLTASDSGTAAPSMPKTASAKQRVETFAMLDVNSDGFLSREELARAFSELGCPLTKEDLNQRMAQADLDGDDLISFDEFEVVYLGEGVASVNDYGFRNMGYYGSDVGDPSTPTNAFRSAFENFKREYDAIRRAVLYGETDLVRGDEAARKFGEGPSPSNPAAQVGEAIVRKFAIWDRKLVDKGLLWPLQPALAQYPRYSSLLLRKELSKLTLSNEAIERRERERIKDRREVVRQMGGETSPLRAVREAARTDTPWFVMAPYVALCKFLDVCFDGRPIARFHFLELVARVPYFSYLSMLHLYETLGWWKSNSGQIRLLHVAQEQNELHHLLIMEALGGDRRWADRFLARHAAILYFWTLCLLFLLSPSLSYGFSELLESHAVDTYCQFMEENEALLKRLPAPEVALRWYADPEFGYLRDMMRTSERATIAAAREGGTERRARKRPQKIETLYDVFQAICADESEHVSTMRSCQDTVDDLAEGSNDSREVAEMDRAILAAMDLDVDGSGAASWAQSATEMLKVAMDRLGDAVDEVVDQVKDNKPGDQKGEEPPRS